VERVPGKSHQLVPCAWLMLSEMWEMLALTLPFLAAVLVWTGRQRRVSASDVGGLLVECGVCLAASVLGTFAFLLCLFALGMLIHKLG
jgi:hypothetical protein